MNILNLYCGLGGNRKLWQGHNITAIEINPEIANVYSTFFPKDKVIIENANKYLLEHYKEFDFIWSSPPCQSHSKMRFLASKRGSYTPIMPDLKLYSEILFLKHFFKGKWVVENVKPYYEPLIKPNVILGRHCIWSNFEIIPKEFNDGLSHNERGTHKKGVFDLTGFKLKHRKDQLIRNSVNPEIGKYILQQYEGERK